MYVKLLSQSRKLGYTCSSYSWYRENTKIVVSVLPIKYFASQILLILLLERDHFLSSILSSFELQSV